MNVALPWLLLVGRKPITATRGVNPFFMLQLRCATFRFPLPQIPHAPTRADAGRTGALGWRRMTDLNGGGMEITPVYPIYSCNYFPTALLTLFQCKACGSANRQVRVRNDAASTMRAGTRCPVNRKGSVARPLSCRKLGIHLKFRLTLMFFFYQWTHYF
jgi:hypothetical protein